MRRENSGGRGDGAASIGAGAAFERRRALWTVPRSSRSRICYRESAAKSAAGYGDRAARGEKMKKTTSRKLALPLISPLCAGCSAAPSVDVIGSFFPAWMVCIIVAVALAFVVRYVLLRFQLESEVGHLG